MSDDDVEGVVWEDGHARPASSNDGDFQPMSFKEIAAKKALTGGPIKEMDRHYPGLGHHLEEETTVAIDGAIHETAYFQPIRPGCEVFFIPKLEGG
jgi:hypothetical protein